MKVPGCKKELNLTPFGALGVGFDVNYMTVSM
jgi:hypothetical protein